MAGPATRTSGAVISAKVAGLREFIYVVVKKKADSVSEGNRIWVVTVAGVSRFSEVWATFLAYCWVFIAIDTPGDSAPAANGTHEGVP